ncbi:MAG: hypothetical protein DSY42_02370 [Aquifex sp.]|nr:MAG: hypothetical protein DSY42_02370 [Aquifex sp.]
MIPIILGIIGAGSAIVGVVATVDAATKLKEAENIVKRAERKYKKTEKEFEREKEKLNANIEKLGRLTKKVYKRLNDFAKLMRKLDSNVKIRKNVTRYKLDELIGEIERINRGISTLKGSDVFEVIGKAVFTSGASYLGTISLGTAIGTASTGTAIATLSGAAFENALLAWLGGGAIAAGGGGIALGTLILGGITLGPAILVGGLVLNGKAEEALTEAREYEKEVEKAIAKAKIVIEKLRWLNRKANSEIRVRKSLFVEFDEKLSLVEKKFYRNGIVKKEDIRTLVNLAKNLKEAMDEPIIKKEELV